MIQSETDASDSSAATGAAANPATVALSLISHTNVGKTTLLRTLLRRDVGDVADRAHVTELAESHVLGKQFIWRMIFSI